MEMQKIMEMLVEMKATADADMYELNAKMEAIQKRAEARMVADRKTDMYELSAKMEAIQEKAEARMAKFEGKMEETMELRMKHLMMATWNTHTETKKIEQDPRMMQSVEEHQDIPTQDAVVMSVGERRKRHRVWKPAVERCQKRKDRTWGNHGM
jgi:protoporphyrinogen oxidase